jgi:hypothetical protein
VIGRWISRRAEEGTAAIACTAGAALVLRPALVFDARVLAHPVTFRYPSLDDRRYVTGDEVGSPWPALTAEIRPAGKRNSGRDPHAELVS